MKINYMIAACAMRSIKGPSMGIEGRDVLKLHLRELKKTDTSVLDQITIIRALPLYSGSCGNCKLYWDVDISGFGCNVVFVDFPNYFFSYSLWLEAVQLYRNNFDYYILVEDDYYPALENFAEVLVDLHKKKLPSGGYLNSFTVASFTPGNIPAVSNGIVDAVSFLGGISQARPTPMKALVNSGGQRGFGCTFFGSNVTDYTDTYRTLFKSNELVEETHDRSRNFKQDIFNPIEYLVVGERDFIKSVC